MNRSPVASEGIGASPPVLRILLSSTAEDLAEHRAKMALAIEELGQRAVRMEAFGARDSAPLAECRKLAAEADALVVCVAYRYGWIPSKNEGGDGETSVTWHEVNAALEAGKPVFAFVVDPKAPWTAQKEQDRLEEAKSRKQQLEVAKAVQGLRRFKEYLGSIRVRPTFTTPDDLARKVATGLANWIAEHTAASAEVPQGPSSVGPSEILDFTLERSRHTDFYGRQDVFAELDRLLDSKLERGWVLVTGGPGLGKSALLSRYLNHLESTGRPVPHHFLRRGSGNSARPEVIVRSLAAQVEALYPEQVDLRAHPANRLIELLGRVSKEILVPAAERLVLVIDGLDEAESEGAVNPLPQFLPFTLPAGVFILCASRPTYPELGWLDARERVRRLDLDSPPWAGSNREAVEEFWANVAVQLEPPLASELVDAAIDRAEGNLLHAVKLREWLIELPEKERRIEIVPRGLKGFLTEIWGRLQTLDAETFGLVENGLGLLCAAREALPTEILAAVLDWQGAKPWGTFLHHARPLLLEEPAPWVSGRPAYSLFHESFRAFLAKDLNPETMRAHHALLAARLAAWPPTGPEREFRRRYALRYAFFHCIEGEARRKTENLATDLSYLEARCREEGVDGIEADLRRALRRWSGESDLELLIAMERTIRTESHHLRLDPSAVPAQLYTGLRNQAWDEDQIIATLNLPFGVPRLRLLHPLHKRGSELRTLAHDGAIKCSAVTPDGEWVATGTLAGTLSVWDLDRGVLLATRHDRAAIMACALAAGGRRVASVSDDGTLRVWDLERGVLLATKSGQGFWGRACAITTNGSRVVFGSDNGTLSVWDVEQRKLLATFEGCGPVTSCGIAADGRRAVSGAADGTVQLWDVESGALLVELKGDESAALACAITTSGRRVIAGFQNSTWSVWNSETGLLLTTIVGSGGETLACAISSDSRLAVSAALDGYLVMWDLEAGKLLVRLESQGGWIWTCAVAPNGRRVVSGSVDGRMRVWDLEKCPPGAAIEGHGGGVWNCKVMPDARRVVSASLDGTARVWDLESGSLVSTLEGAGGPVLACDVSPDGRRVITGSMDGHLRVWDWQHCVLEATIKAHQGRVSACALTSDGGQAISASADGTIRVWDLREGALQSTFYHGAMRDFTLVPDGRRVVSGSDGCALRVWDYMLGSELSTKKSHDGVRALAATPDGKQIVAGLVDGALKLWDLNTGALLATLEGDGSPIVACAVTADGRYVISGSWSGTLRLWDLHQGRVLESLGGRVAFLSVHIVGKKVAAGDAAGNVWMLRLCDEVEGR